MMNTDMKQTVFHIEKLKNVVNVGDSSAYQIFTYPGSTIGRFGPIVNPEQHNPANEAVFHATTEANTSENRPASWTDKVLSAFRRQQ